MNKSLSIKETGANQTIRLVLLLGILLSGLIAGLILVGQIHDPRKWAQTLPTVDLKFMPDTSATAPFSLPGGQNKSFILKAVFNGASANGKLDGFFSVIHFNKDDLKIPDNTYIDVSSSGFNKTFRVDGPVAANMNGDIVIKLGTSVRNGGPSIAGTDKEVTIATITFAGKRTATGSITIGDTQIVDNSSRILNITNKASAFYQISGAFPLPPSPTPSSTSAGTRANLCVSSTINGTTLKSNTPLTITSTANTDKINLFTYAFYNLDNLYPAPNYTPKPIFFQANTPFALHKTSNGTSTETITLYADSINDKEHSLNKLDQNWNNQRASRIQVNAYFTDFQGRFAYPDPKCVVQFNIDFSGISSPTGTNASDNSLAGSSNPLFRLVMDLWNKSKLTLKQMLGFISQLNRVPGLQKNTCDPNVGQCDTP